MVTQRQTQKMVPGPFQIIVNQYFDRPVKYLTQNDVFVN